MKKAGRKILSAFIFLNFNRMYKKQLGRRNLTEEVKTVLIGKMYEARKKREGGQAGNQNAKRLPQNGEVDSGKRGTAIDIAKELGVGHNTVKRAEKFAHGIDALKAVSPEAATDGQRDFSMCPIWAH